MVDQVRQDIDLALKITKWERKLFENTLRLMDSLLDCFGALDNLRSACNHKKRIPVRGGPQDFADLVQDMDKAVQRYQK
jgi:hypothetical protein